MVHASNLGFPRIGSKRQLKRALENYWNGRSTEQNLIESGRQLRQEAWQFQADQQLDFIPSNDFSFYDHVLDTIAMVGAVPGRFEWTGDKVDLRTYFLMARGAIDTASTNGKTHNAPAMEMTKWFNTNYHFIVPEIEEQQRFKLASTKFLDEFIEARDLGIITRPVMVGPITFMYLAKGHRLENEETLLHKLVDVYLQALIELKAAGAEWVQIDEPCLSLDLNERARQAFEFAYRRLADSKLSILVATYFGALKENLSVALKLPIQGLHLDLLNGREDLEPVLRDLPEHMQLSAGVVDGHNVWRCNLDETANLLESIAEKIGPERLTVAPTCSLIHVPIDSDSELKLDKLVSPLLSFAKQKIREVSILTDILCCGRIESKDILTDNAEILTKGEESPNRNNSVVRNRLSALTPEMSRRRSSYPDRKIVQTRRFNLPLFPTTTIGSFPQTESIREARKKWKAKELSTEQYEKSMQDEIKNNLSLQEKVGLDVFVHGEPERTDMVEYFAEQLDGVAITQHGWVQSYGSRYVKPPIIHGDVTRPEPMTVEWARFAQAQTSRPVKGMLTGPVTMLQWSFVRDDQPREQTCKQLALAIRDEVTDLEAAGIKIIQIDEPAIREGLPLRRADWASYLKWSTECFRISSTGVEDDTQIHTHMCYSEFGDMVQSIAEMDADVISIEAARSRMDLLDALKETGYPNEIGPGVFDIHSPRIPQQEELEWLLEKALKVIPKDRLWVNPDCGLKTRNWNEVIPALNAMVQAAIRLRQSVVEPDLVHH